ncbi:MAG TPA: DNA methyltransferase [Nitriliruptorales bacterium]
MAEPIPLSVWPVAQRTSKSQRTRRYVPASNAHPGKMLPALARHIIETYTDADDLVLDPMCGIGTTLVEAIHLGRGALGVEYEDRWAQLAQANIDHAYDTGASGTATVRRRDARDLVLDPELAGRVALVLTSPPYGPSVHGQVRAVAGQGVSKRHDRYSRDPDNLAHTSRQELLDGFTAILAGCVPLLRPGGVVAITARPWRQHGCLVDLPAQAAAAAERAGLTLYERNVALLAALRDGRLVPRSSFFQLVHVRKARQRGRPHFVIAHEDVLILRKPPA